jgi:hypothetical protein
VTNALNHQAYTQFDYATGKPVNGEDANGIVSKGSYSDLLDRATELVVAVVANGVTNPPEMRKTLFSYDDVAKAITTTSDHTAFGDTNPLKGQIVYDGLGRTIESRQYETISAYIKTTTEYDGMGRAFKSSNPYRTGDTLYYTTTDFDGLGRVKTVTAPDNSVVTSSYNGNQTTVRDQANKQRRSTTLVFGDRLPYV